ncbi:MAG TPA: hypothetical protein PKK06_15245 [Phycisphaerae bacterium]|nr:hypothetical protein [Phycisphaerae bacterium]HNU46681.1 hypothetical protein [Phycisphaerae bacterium]
MSTWMWIVLISYLLAAGAHAVLCDDLPKAYRGRGCMGRAWKRRFPDASGAEIRRFLTIFIEAFGFREQQRLKFAPDDKLMGVYRAMYPWWRVGDCIETEVLLMNLEDEYKTEYPEQLVSGNVTLGGIFEYMRANGRPADHGLHTTDGGSLI